jgi:para-aminobenzoate synthetase/4-amino-4-deoxychorismate lyase
VVSLRVPLDSTLSPEEAVLALRGTERPFALVGEWASVSAILGCSPVRTAHDPFEAFAEGATDSDGEAVVGGGWFGILGYGLGSLVERLPPPPPAPVPMPACSLAFYDHVVVLDDGRWWFESLLDEHPAVESWRERLARAPEPRPFSVGPLALRAPGAAGHLAAVEDCVRRIAEGELFQANLTLRLEGSLAGDPLDLFAHALPRARPRFGALFDGVVSLSPERFLRRVGRHVETDPIKGTATDPQALRESAKDAAEHVMIVDLMRNDLGRVCAYGSLQAHEPRLEPHANVWHLVSTVSGELRDGATDADLLRATFPPGSVTGAPKVQAMKVIAELEATRREAYTGAIGYVSPIAGLELSVTIRTFETAGDRIWLGAGGGIVADSDPAAELREALDKATGPATAASTQVVGRRSSAVSRQTSTNRGGPRVRRALELAPRPDPSLGLLETILVRDGRAPALDRHIARLTASARALYGIEPRPDLAARIKEVPGDARVRVILSPEGTTTIESIPLAAPAPKQGFQPFLLPGGLGAHKWADRRLNEAIAHAAGTKIPLLVDTDGTVLETDRANVYIEDDGVLITPRADGRILPGTTQQTLDAVEDDIALDRFRAAERILLSSAIAGVREAATARARRDTGAYTRPARRSPA